MDRNWGTAIWVGVLLNTNGLAADVRTRHVEPTELTVRFYNYAVVPDETLNAAQRKTEDIFRAAGIRITWAECPVSEKAAERVTCPKLNDRQPVTLQIVPHSIHPHRPGEFGLASYPGVYIFFDDIRNYSGRHLAPETIVLGEVMAHEIGHLLLGPGSHSSSGIMRPDLQANDLRSNDRHFTRAQADKMRAKIRRN